MGHEDQRVKFILVWHPGCACVACGAVVQGPDRVPFCGEACADTFMAPILLGGVQPWIHVGGEYAIHPDGLYVRANDEKPCKVWKLVEWRS